MTSQVAIAFGAPLALGLAALGCGLGLGRAVAAAMEATGRQPEASGKIMVNMLLGCALIEALSLYALVFAFALLGKM